MAKGRSEADSDTAATRRGRPRSAETTNAILQSAYTLMATTGLAATSIDAVARHSNVSKMTIYKWWPSREALLIDAFLNHASLMLPLPTSGTPADASEATPRLMRGAIGSSAVQLAVISECISNTGLRRFSTSAISAIEEPLYQLTPRPAGRKHCRRRDAGRPA
jgi:AcrR family transcriptional regulator